MELGKKQMLTVVTEAYTGGKCNTEGSAGWQIRCLPGLGTGKGFVPAI